MNIDRWQQIVEMVKSSFDVEESGITNNKEAVQKPSLLFLMDL